MKPQILENLRYFVRASRSWHYARPLLVVSRTDMYMQVPMRNFSCASTVPNFRYFNLAVYANRKRISRRIA